MIFIKALIAYSSGNIYLETFNFTILVAFNSFVKTRQD